MTKIKLILLLCFFVQVTVSAQVKIGDNTNTINGASLLELETTNKGFVFPRVALTSLSSPSPLPAGLLTGTVIFNTASGIGTGVGLYYWSGSAWVAAGAGAVSTAWSLTGNDNTTANTSSFLGTKTGTAVPLLFEAQGDTVGYLGLKTTSNAVSFGAGASGANTANGSVAIGTGAKAIAGNAAVALGSNAVAGSFQDIAIGANAQTATSSSNIAIGAGAQATSSNAIALGSNATASNKQIALAIGVSASSTGFTSMAIGNGAKSDTSNTTAFGALSLAHGVSANAFGNRANATGDSSLAVGNLSAASKSNSIAIGTRASATGVYSSVLGTNSSATGDSTTVIGNNLAVTASNVLILGATSKKIGIGTINPGNKVTIVGASVTDNPLFISKLQPTSTLSSDSILTINGGIVKAAPFSSFSGGGGSGWLLTGNSNTISSTNFVGTTDDHALVFKTNNTTAGFIGSTNDGLGRTSLGSSASAGDQNATAIGFGANASANQSTALGFSASATSQNALSLGVNAAAAQSAAIAVGFQAQATAQQSIAIGNAANASASINNIAIGTSAAASVQNGIAIGPNAKATTQLTAMALGNNANAGGQSSTAIGDGSAASGQSSLALGVSAVASQTNTISIGNGAQATQSGATAFGTSAQATASAANAFGNSSVASGAGSLAVGNSASATGGASLAVGDFSSAGDLNTIAIGNTAKATKQNTTVMGFNSTASGIGATVIGNNSSTTGANSIVLGENSSATGDSTTAIGNNLTVSASNVLILGGLAKKIGIGTVNPGNKVSIVGASLTDNPLFISKLQPTSTLSSDSVLTINSGIVKAAPFASFSASNSAWSLTGNANTDTTVNFLGTTDGKYLNFKTNNKTAITISPGGNVNIGLPSNGLTNNTLGVANTMELKNLGATGTSKGSIVSQFLFSNSNGINGADVRMNNDGGDFYFQGGGGRNTQLATWWTILLSGDRQVGTAPRFFYGNNSGDPQLNTGVLVKSQRNVSVPLAIQGALTQTANLTEWRDSSSAIGKVLSVVDKTGNFGIGIATPGANLDVNGTVKLGASGSVLSTGIIKGSGSQALGTIAANTTTEFTFSVTNVPANANVIVNPNSSGPPALAAGLVIAYSYTKAGSVVVAIRNETGSGVAGGSPTFVFTIIQ